MGAPDSGMQGPEQSAGESLLTAFRTIRAAERARHGQVLDYWLSIRGDKEFPPLHDLDPLELSDAGPCSILLELIGGGQDAEIRHLGEALKADIAVQRIIDAPNPSILSCIAKKLPIVAISRDFLAFEDSFNGADGWTRCWVTLLPLSSCGSWVDYVYAFVSVETNSGKPAEASAPDVALEVSAEEAVADVCADESEIVVDVEPATSDEAEEPPAGPVDQPEEVEISHTPEPDESADAPDAKTGPGFSKLLDGVTKLAGFYGQGVKIDPLVEVEVPIVDPAVVEPVAVESQSELQEPDSVEPEPAGPVSVEPPLELQLSAPASEGSMQSKLSEVRAKADEARLAQLRATAALHEGLSAAYDFALDAEAGPEEYLRLVEEQGMKIQLRAPMAPVVKLAFSGLADDTTIAELETVLAWALKQELPRGSLAERIEQAGGIDELLNGASRSS